MLGTHDAISMIAVKDTKVAQKFYEEVLGLKIHSTVEAEHVLTCHSGKTHFLIYRSDFAGTNKANALVWSVGEEIEEIVQALKKKGVKFEHFQFPNTDLEGDLHIAGSLKLAWFKDPDGNILHLINT